MREPRTLAVVAFPAFGPEGAWVEQVRAAHDPQVALVRAHFTLIFPAPGDAGLMLQEVRAVGASCGPFDVALTQAEVVPDVVAGGYGVFLVPSDGREEIAALHHELYRGS